jgi:GNAT superfamily N-acetyltransferase
MQSSSGVREGVRPAVREDVPRIWGLVQELAEYERLSHTVSGSAEALERYAFEERLIEVFVCETEGEIVGYSITFATFSTFLTRPGIWLEDLYVTPRVRGRGFGRALLRNVLVRGAERGCERVEWSVLDWNEPAIRFYEAMGATILPDWKICRVVTPRSSDPA